MAKPTGATDGTWLKALDLKSFITPVQSIPLKQISYVLYMSHSTRLAQQKHHGEEKKAATPVNQPRDQPEVKCSWSGCILRKPAKLVDYILIWQFCPNQISEIRVSNSYFSFISQPIQPAQVFFIFFLASCLPVYWHVEVFLVS